MCIFQPEDIQGEQSCVRIDCTHERVFYTSSSFLIHRESRDGVTHVRGRSKNDLSIRERCSSLDPRRSAFSPWLMKYRVKRETRYTPCTIAVQVVWNTSSFSTREPTGISPNFRYRRDKKYINLSHIYVISIHV